MANKTVHSLIREDFRRRDQERLEQALLDGLESGRGVEIRTRGDWKKFWKKLIFYKSHDDGIEIVRVLHGARDYPSLFG